MNKNVIVMYDLETSGKDPFKSQIIQIGAIAVDPKKMLPIKGGVFNSLIKPYEGEECEKYDLEEPQQKALDINKKTLKELRKAPDSKIVFKKFEEWIKQYKNGNSIWDNPVRAGFNIHGFDDIFMDRYCVGHNSFSGTKEEPFGFGPENNGRQGLFHPVMAIDLLQYLSLFLCNKYIPELNRSMSLDSLRSYFGLKGSNAHDSIGDVTDCIEILHRLNRLNNKFLEDGISFKGSCKNRIIDLNKYV